MVSEPTSNQETKEFMDSLSKKSIASKVIIWSSDDKILLVKPHYKPTWQFPGGAVDEREDPKVAAVRELREELGLEVDTDDLKLLDSVLRQEFDNLILIYEYQVRIDPSLDLQIQEEELSDIRLFELGEVRSLLADYYLGFFDNHFRLVTPADK